MVWKSDTVKKLFGAMPADFLTATMSNALKITIQDHRMMNGFAPTEKGGDIGWLTERRLSKSLITQKTIIEEWVPILEQYNTPAGIDEAIALLKEQEAIKPTINEYGKAYCVCGENVGIIPNSKNLPKICSKYCPECGRRMK